MNLLFSRRLLASCGLALAVALAGAGVAPAQDDKVVATVNGSPITEAEIKIAEGDLDPQFRQLPPEQRRSAALSALVEIKLFAAQAEEAGLGEDDEFKRRMEFLRLRALHSAYVDAEVTSKVSEEAIRERYDQEVANTPPSNEIRARHILVKTKEEAEGIIESLDAGGDFEAIAKEKSTDGAAAQGGDLGYFSQGQMVPEFETAAFALDVGAYSKEPVETQFGFHVIKVEDKRTKQPPAYEQVKEQVRSLLLREAYFSEVQKLREAATVETDDPDLKKVLEQATQPK